jgi:hypothetical protein
VVALRQHHAKRKSVRFCLFHLVTQKGF